MCVKNGTDYGGQENLGARGGCLKLALPLLPTGVCVCLPVQKREYGKDGTIVGYEGMRVCEKRCV